MRIVKEAEERKNEILDAAGELFAQKGFDGTSTNDILEKVGIARGTLYYHFGSKEEIMDELIGRTTDRIIVSAKKAAADKSIPISERMLQVVLALRISDGRGQELIKQMHKPQNALMHQKVQKATLKGVTPILTEVIQDGIKEGLFHTPYPYECMEMVMTYVNTVFDGDDTVEMTEEEHRQRLQAFIFNVERMLGVESGTMIPTVTQMFGGGKEPHQGSSEADF